MVRVLRYGLKESRSIGRISSDYVKNVIDMTTIIDREHKRLVGYYHKLCNDMGMSVDDRKAMLFNAYGVESSVDLDNHQLTDLVHSLEKKVHPAAATQDMLRKRVIAAIGGWLRSEGRVSAEYGIGYIKQIACRATGYDEFNKIPNERLRNLYNTFRNKQRDKRAVEKVVDDELLRTVEQYKRLGMIAEA